MPLVRNLQKLINLQIKSSGFDRMVKGVQVLHAQPGKLHCELKVGEEHLNANGTLHGGMTCTLIDIISTYAIATTKERKFGVSVDLNVSFLSAVRPGETITMKCEVLRTGRNLAFANTDIFKDDGKMVATGRHTKFL